MWLVAASAGLWPSPPGLGNRQGLLTLLLDRPWEVLALCPFKLAQQEVRTVAVPPSRLVDPNPVTAAGCWWRLGQQQVLEVKVAALLFWQAPPLPHLASVGRCSSCRVKQLRVPTLAKCSSRRHLFRGRLRAGLWFWQPVVLRALVTLATLLLCPGALRWERPAR